MNRQLPLRSECICQCHASHGSMMHMMECCQPDPLAQNPNTQIASGVREISLVRAELVDALHDYAAIFREKAAMEERRAAAVDAMADKIAKGGSAQQQDIQQSANWEREQQFIGMRFQELQLKCNRLILEHGDN